MVEVYPPKDGVELIGQMRERYLGKWYRTLTFVQKTTLPDGKVETWYEAAELPGKLRIDIAPLEGKNTSCSGTTRSTSSRPESWPNRVP